MLKREKFGESVVGPRGGPDEEVGHLSIGTKMSSDRNALVKKPPPLQHTEVNV